MLLMRYLDHEVKYKIEYKKHSKNVVEIVGDIPVKTTGFILSREGKNDNFDYSAFKTIYRKLEKSILFSNDGSEYIEPIPVVSFYTNGGGILEGALSQEVRTYEEVIVPTPIANDDYGFTCWSPEIPESGEIVGNKSFTAIFTSTIPVPEPEPVPSLEEEVTALKKSVSTLESDVQAINTALGGASDE